MKQPRIAALCLAFAVSLALSACSRTTEPSSQPTQESAAQASQPAGSFSIGELSATPLRDGAFEFPNDGKVVGVNRKPEEVAELLAANGLPTDKVNLSVTPLLVKGADRVMLFDTGAGSNFGQVAGHLPEALAEAGVDPATVTDIFISHVHGDHTGGLIDGEGKLVFPNATIHIGAADWAYLQGLSADQAAQIGQPQHAQLVAAITAKVAAFEPDAELVPGVVKAVAIRGHTPGHSGFLIGSGPSSVLYIGDTMHHYVVSVQKPDWTINFDGEPATAEQSRADVLARSAENGQRIYAVHFPYPPIGKFEHRGEGYVWVPEQ
jgi:glyoxylase-like metal-dependent hydrolase (beta-lactamase superfamily II)